MTVKINNKTYEVPELEFRHLPMMEKCGLSIQELMGGNHLFTAIEVFTTIVVGCDTAEADRLLQQHILGGGTFDPLVETFGKAIDESSFFKRMLAEETE